MSLRAACKFALSNFVLGLALAAPPPAFAQGESRFSGAVLDPSGAPVPGASVLVRNERTREERSAVTNATGRYVVTGLRPSVYTVRASFTGFAPLEYTALALATGQDFALDLALRPAGMSELITVEGTSKAID